MKFSLKTFLEQVTACNWLNFSLWIVKLLYEKLIRSVICFYSKNHFLLCVQCVGKCKIPKF